MIIEIPDIHPSINTWKNWHWAVFSKEKKRWAEMIGWLCKGLTPIEGRVFVTITVYFGTKHRHDYDNYTPKFILDPIVEAGLIADDSSMIITELRLKFKYDKDHPRTEVLIEEDEEDKSQRMAF